VQLAGTAPQLLGCTACIPTELLWLLIMLADEYILWKTVVPNLPCSSYIFSLRNASKCCALCKRVCLNQPELTPPCSLNKNLPVLQTTECPSNSHDINPLNPELNPIYYFLTLLAHHFLHVSRIMVKSLTLRLLMSHIYIYIYIYGAHILDVSRSHTTHHSR